MAIIAFILLSWTAICWFSGPFDHPFLGLPLFDLDPAALLFATLLWSFAAVILWAKRYGAEAWRRTIVWIGAHRVVLALLVAILLVHALLQLPSIIFYRGANDSDSATHGLAGYHIADGESRPMFRYGLHYIGSLVPHLAALLQLLFGKSPLHLQIVNALFYTGFIVVLFALVRRLFDDRVALLAAALVAIPPFEVYRHLNHPEFPCILFWGTLSLYLLSRMLEDERPGWRRYFWYGAVLGIGLWTHPQVVYYIVVGIAALLIRDKLFFVRPQFAAAPVGFVLGGIVNFVDSYYYDWYIFVRFFSQAAEPVGWLERLLPGVAGFFGSWPAYLGLWPDYDGRHLLGPWVTWLVIGLFVAAIVLYILNCREQIASAVKLKNISIGPALFLLLVFIVLVIFSISEQSAPPTPMRYIFPFWSAVPVFVAAASFHAARRSRAASAALATVFVCVFFWSLLLQFPAIQERDEAYRDWESFCRREGITRFYGQFWRSYLISFTSAEGIVGSESFHSDSESYPPYRRLVADAAEAPAFLFTRGEEQRLATLEVTLKCLRIGYRKSLTSLGSVIHNVGECVTPSRLLNIMPVRHEAIVTGWTVAAVEGLRGSADVRMLTLSVENRGQSLWRTDGRNGFIELSVQAADGAELRRQPLFSDVGPGRSIVWRVLLEADEGPVEVSILLNDFVISTGRAPLRLELEPSGDVEAINANSLNAVRFRQVSGAALGVDYMFVSGWGATVRGEETIVRWSGGRESVIGFFTARARPLRLVLRLSPIQAGSRLRGAQVVRIFCNGVELPEPIYLPRPRRVEVELPERYVRAGLNYLRLRYRLLENEYGRLERQLIALLRPRAAALNLLRFRQEGSD